MAVGQERIAQHRPTCRQGRIRAREAVIWCDGTLPGRRPLSVYDELTGTRPFTDQATKELL
ncbi:hypothetical protein EEJ42_07290 [Streptomyces botrytidirepellens]|uniref:Uncharacterized protein n=1 Tax=Streptomyces botrytidirepellens TaxID=2486417 RepID=A0A3M8WY94_9ACTN|nr:hypothetical protein EEJ42_07290 [Streptomyces botrytidirepellens]